MPFCAGSETPVHYETDGAGPPVVLINGLVASAFLWPAPWIERLAGSRRVIRVSNRGTGHTEPGDGIAIETMAADVVAVLDAEAVDEVDVLGFSMGGMVAQALALGWSSRVRRLVLSSTTTGGANDVHPDFVEAIGKIASSPGEAAASLFPLIVAPGFWDDHPEVLADLGAGWQAAPTPPETGTAQLMAAARFDSRDRLGDVTAPTLVLHGLEDRLLVPAGGERVAAGIRGARLETFEAVGHMVAYEAPESVDLVTEFLDSP